MIIAKICLRLIAIVSVAASLSACVTQGPAPKSYTLFRAEAPRSILVVPTLNNTSSVTAPEFFLSTISRPFAERGYYVFPAHMVKEVLERDGLADAGLVHAANPERLGTLFGCDAVLMIKIQQWDSKYIVISTTTTVKFDYSLKSCKTGATIWEDQQTMAYSPQGNSSGNPIADLLAAAIIAALEKGAPNYMPLTVQANTLAAGTPGRGLPSGPYLPESYGKDLKVFP